VPKIVDVPPVMVLARSVTKCLSSVRPDFDPRTAKDSLAPFSPTTSASGVVPSKPAVTSVPPPPVLLLNIPAIDHVFAFSCASSNTTNSHSISEFGSPQDPVLVQVRSAV